jgi:hypothetical protein
MRELRRWGAGGNRELPSFRGDVTATALPNDAARNHFGLLPGSLDGTHRRQDQGDQRNVALNGGEQIGPRLPCPALRSPHRLGYGAEPRHAPCGLFMPRD